MIELNQYEKIKKRVRKDRDKLEHTLTLLGARWIKENYGVELRHKVEVNARLTRTMGCIRAGGHGINSIEVSEVVVMDYKLTGDTENLMGVLKHELIHYALYELGKPFKDKDEYFKNECKRHGAPLGVTGLTRLMHEYECDDGHRIRRIRKLDVDLYNCGCGCDLKYQGKIVRKH